MSNWSDFNLQNALSPLMEQLMFFHNHTLIILIVITMIVSYNLTLFLIMLTLMSIIYVNKMLLEGQVIEFIWTFLPVVTLFLIAFP